ncbi:hypothetical protein BGW37DRAFT_287398 [Umbelopsis sp. PMI_123]|nr:hypothetical protein BGW37DRAFT_287398 [Umbelopsis sp. PMI_123]
MKQRRNRRFTQDSEFALNHILNHRIPRICEALAQSGATQVGELLRVSASLDVACCDARKLLWQINILNGPEPSMPEVLSTSSIKKKAKVTQLAHNSSSDESLSSEQSWSSHSSDDDDHVDSSDGGWSDFIVEDDHLTSDDGLGEQAEWNDYHSGSEHSDLSEWPFKQKDRDSDASEIRTLNWKKRPREEVQSDESTRISKRAFKGSTSNRNRSTRSNSENAWRARDSDDEQSSSYSANDVHDHTTTKAHRQMRLGKQSSHESGKILEFDSEAETVKKVSDISMNSSNEWPTKKKDKENDKVPEEEEQIEGTESGHSDNDQSIRHSVKNYMSRRKFPQVKQAFLKMSNADVLSLFLSLDLVQNDDLNNDEHELLEELKPIIHLLSDNNDISKLAQDDEETMRLTRNIQIVRDILMKPVVKKKPVVRSKANARFKNRRILDSDDESDVDDDERKSDSDGNYTSSANGISTTRQSGFRKIRDETEAVSNLRKHHQKMWKDIEERAETYVIMY